MKYLKKFENTVFNKEEIKKMIFKRFPTENDFYNWLFDTQEIDNEKFIDWEGLQTYDLPKELGLPVNNQEVSSIIVDVLIDGTLDDFYAPRDNDNPEKTGELFGL